MFFDSLAYYVRHSGIKGFRKDIVLMQFVVRDKTRDSECRRKLHFFSNLGRPSFQRSLKDAGESDYIIYLIREIAASGSDYLCACLLGKVGHDLRHRIGQGKENGVRIHGSRHFLGYDTGRGDADEDIRSLQGVCKASLFSG